MFFPYERLKTPIEAAFYKKTGISLSIKKIYYGFPFYINFSSIGSRTFYIKRAGMDISPVVLLNYIIFKNILLKLNLNGVNVKNVLGISGINLNEIDVNFHIIKPGMVQSPDMANSASLSGTATFNGGLKGNLKIVKASINPFNISDGILKLKIKNKTISKKYGLLMKTIFKSSKNGYYVYYIKNFMP